MSSSTDDCTCLEYELTVTIPTLCQTFRRISDKIKRKMEEEYDTPPTDYQKIWPSVIYRRLLAVQDKVKELEDAAYCYQLTIDSMTPANTIPRQPINTCPTPPKKRKQPHDGKRLERNQFFNESPYKRQKTTNN